MEEDRQLKLWTLLGTTQAVVDATGEQLVRPGKVSEPHAKGPASLDAQIKRRVGAGSAPDLGKSGAAFPHAGAAKGKARIVAAKHGNAFIVTRRRD